jgi:hypothetical protein
MLREELNRDTFAEGELKALRTNCGNTGSLCESMCFWCDSFVSRKKELKEEWVTERRCKSMTELHATMVKEDAAMNASCERCNCRRSLEWSFETAYLCNTCVNELENVTEAQSDAERLMLHAVLFPDDVIPQSLLRTCQGNYKLADMSSTCIACNTLGKCIADVEVNLCSSCYENQFL